MADNQYSAQARVQILLEFLQERQMDLEHLAERKRVKLEQFVQLSQFREDANQVSVRFVVLVKMRYFSKNSNNLIITNTK